MCDKEHTLAARSVPEAELKEALENVERYVAVAREEKERAQASEAEASDLRRKLDELERRFDLELDAYAKDSDMADLRRKLEEARYVMTKLQRWPSLTPLALLELKDAARAFLFTNEGAPSAQTDGGGE